VTSQSIMLASKFTITLRRVHLEEEELRGDKP